jgi:hypothetical protein
MLHEHLIKNRGIHIPGFFDTMIRRRGQSFPKESINIERLQPHSYAC